MTAADQPTNPSHNPRKSCSTTVSDDPSCEPPLWGSCKASWGWRGYQRSEMNLVFRCLWVAVALLAAWFTACLDVDRFAAAMNVLVIPLSIVWAYTWERRWHLSKQHPWAFAKSSKQKSSKQGFGTPVLLLVDWTAVSVLAMLALFAMTRGDSKGTDALFAMTRGDSKGTDALSAIVGTPSLYLPSFIAFMAVLAMTIAVRMPKLFENPESINLSVAVGQHVPLGRMTLAVVIDGLVMAGLLVYLVFAANMLGWVHLDQIPMWLAGTAVVVFGYQWRAACRGASIGHKTVGAVLRSVPDRRLSNKTRLCAAVRAAVIVGELAVFTCYVVTRFKHILASDPRLIAPFALTLIVLLVPMHPRGQRPHDILACTAVEWPSSALYSR